MRGAHRPPATPSFLPSVFNPSANASPDQAPMDYPDDGDHESHHAQKVAEPVLAYDVLNNVVLPSDPMARNNPNDLKNQTLLMREPPEIFSKWVELMISSAPAREQRPGSVVAQIIAQIAGHFLARQPHAAVT